jgi:hypothetical protein
MVASFDLTRYEPPVDYLLGRIEQLTRLLEHGVDRGFVRDEATTVLQELAEFCKRRINFAELEVGLRLELLFESVFQDALLSIVDGWDPASLVQLARKKIELLTEQRQRDLWSQVLSEFRRIDSDEDEEVVADYRLDDNGALPEGFLEPSPPDLLDRLSLYRAWLRGRVIRGMMQRGRQRWPMPAIVSGQLKARDSGPAGVLAR